MTWWRAVAGYPPTWAAAFLLLVATAALFVVLDPSGFFAAILVSLAAVLVVAWPLSMAMTGTLTQRQFTPPTVQDIDPAELEQLAAELGRLDDPQPSEQLAVLPGKRQSLLSVLQRRLDSGELTYSRYLASARQLLSSVSAACNRSRRARSRRSTPSARRPRRMSAS